MEIRKTLLYVILSIIGVALWTQWQRDYPPAPSSSHVQQAADNNTTNDKIKYYTRYLNPLTSNMFQNNDFYTRENK